jgi:thiamine kinase-like enzyme
MPQLAEVIARLGALLGPRTGDVEPLSGGITNSNFKVTFGGSEYVVRLPGKDTGKLGIDRDVECTANSKAAQLGIAPRVATSLHDPEAIVTDFVAGRELEASELREPEAMAAVARSLRTFHDSGPQLASDFNSFRVVEDYAAKTKGHGGELPDAYEPALRQAKAIERVLHGDEHRPVPCHNDLLAANFLHDGERILIVDWEYAGMGDRYFDLGNFAVNNELDDQGEATLLEAYFGKAPDTRRRATLKLMRFMSDFREAMWGVLQTEISELDFDFRDYGRKHFERLTATAQDPRFQSRIQEADGSSA